MVLLSISCRSPLAASISSLRCRDLSRIYHISFLLSDALNFKIFCMDLIEIDTLWDIFQCTQFCCWPLTFGFDVKLVWLFTVRNSQPHSSITQADVFSKMNMCIVCVQKCCYTIWWFYKNVGNMMIRYVDWKSSSNLERKQVAQNTLSIEISIIYITFQ